MRVVGKGGGARTVPIDDALERLLEVYLVARHQRFPRLSPAARAAPLFVGHDGKRMTRSAVQYLSPTFTGAAGLGAQKPAGALVHALRHTFATQALETGADVVEVRELLGHPASTPPAGTWKPPLPSSATLSRPTRRKSRYESSAASRGRIHHSPADDRAARIAADLHLFGINPIFAEAAPVPASSPRPPIARLARGGGQEPEPPEGPERSSSSPWERSVHPRVRPTCANGG